MPRGGEPDGGSTDRTRASEQEDELDEEDEGEGEGEDGDVEDDDEEGLDDYGENAFYEDVNGRGGRGSSRGIRRLTENIYFLQSRQDETEAELDKLKVDTLFGLEERLEALEAAVRELKQLIKAQSSQPQPQPQPQPQSKFQAAHPPPSKGQTPF